LFSAAIAQLESKMVSNSAWKTHAWVQPTFLAFYFLFFLFIIIILVTFKLC
jgi:hypothetical protein